ncbi:MAG: sigma-70 family RNA polymerase sigma factor [Rhizobacter sp.]|nr:sigma-70 family RNA polymerase sigma factor [Ferruginibacter sp.]
MNHQVNPSNWLRLYGDYLFSIAMMKLNDRQLAEDIVQDTFLSAIKAVDGFKGESSEKTWLVTILKNKITDHYRKRSSLKEAGNYLLETDHSFTASFFESGPGDIPHWLDNTAPADWGASADKALNREEFYAILQLCIKKMPEKLALVFIAKFVEETETSLICKDFEISSSNYWVIIHRAKVLMRSCLEKNWFLE